MKNDKHSKRWSLMILNEKLSNHNFLPTYTPIINIKFEENNYGNFYWICFVTIKACKYMLFLFQTEKEKSFIFTY